MNSPKRIMTMMSHSCESCMSEVMFFICAYVLRPMAGGASVGERSRLEYSSVGRLNNLKNRSAVASITFAMLAFRRRLDRVRSEPTVPSGEHTTGDIGSESFIRRQKRFRAGCTCGCAICKMGHRSFGGFSGD